MIPFNKPLFLGKELEYVKDTVVNKNKISGDGEYTKMCSKWFEEKLKIQKVLMTTSCTHALEMAAILCDIKDGDEVIMPSYTFVSTADAFVMRGAKIIFVDIKPEDMNIDEELIEKAITSKTKAIVPVHYAGVACNMDRIMEIAEKHNLFVIEDAAQGMMSTYKGKPLGTIGHFGCFSFHETKNYTMGEGGALLIREEQYIEKAEIIREKGTNRSKFFRGQIDKYTWIDFGSSYLPSEMNCAYLYAQLEEAEKVNNERLIKWHRYYSNLINLQNLEQIDIPSLNKDRTYNAHMFYIKLKDIEERTRLIKYLRERAVMAVFHYIPLHTSPAGLRFGEFRGEEKHTTVESERLLRLPFYYDLKIEEIDRISEIINEFFDTEK